MIILKIYYLTPKSPLPGERGLILLFFKPLLFREGFGRGELWHAI